MSGAGRSKRDATKLVCVLGVGRTGTNHLFTMMSQLPGIESRFELFNKRAACSLTADEMMNFSALLGTGIELSPGHPDAVRTVRSRPDLVLSCLRRSLGKDTRLSIFKVFFRHLRAEAVVQHILSQPDVAILFVRRRPIDVFISSRKANATQEWRHIDTTDLKVAIDADDFVQWWSSRVKWYRTLERACWRNGTPFDHVTYETDVDVPPVEAIRSLFGRLERLGVTGLAIPESGVTAVLARQDRTRDVTQKVANWAEFERDLRARGALDAAFQPFPRYQPGPWKRLKHRVSSWPDQVRGFRFSGS